MTTYKLQITRHSTEYGCNEKITSVAGLFANKTYAENTALTLAMNELEDLCGIREDNTFSDTRFVPTMVYDSHFLVINGWNGEDYRPVTVYDILET